MENMVYYRLLLLILLGIICGAIYLANTGSQNYIFITIRSLPYADKFFHFLLMGLLAMLANLTLGYKRLHFGFGSIALGTLLVFGFVFAEELTQLYNPYRMFSIADLMADVAGIFFFSWLGYKFLHKQPTVNRT